MHHRAAATSRPRAPVLLFAEVGVSETGAVIHDVDGSLRSLLARSFPDKAPAIAFDTPTAEWAAAQRGPALSLFLYDIREDLDGRAADWEDVRDERGRVIGRQPPPRRYQLSYLVSAWAKTAEDEHELLSGVLRSVPHGELVPPDDLQGSLVDIAAPVLLRVGIPSAGAGAPGWELLAALGVSPRACLELVVLAPLFAPLVTEIAPPAEEIKLGLTREDGGVKRERGFPYPPSPAPVVPTNGGSDADAEPAAAAAAGTGARTGAAGEAGAAKKDGGKKTGKVAEPATAGAAAGSAAGPMSTGRDWTKVRIVERARKPDEPLEG